MFFCNTCSQPLCAACRELTHKARMFSHHDIVSLAKRTKAKHRKCREWRPYSWLHQWRRMLSSDWSATCKCHYHWQAQWWRICGRCVKCLCVLSSARGAVHPLLHWEQVHALYQVLQRHASVSESTWHWVWLSSPLISSPLASSAVVSLCLILSPRLLWSPLVSSPLITSHLLLSHFAASPLSSCLLSSPIPSSPLPSLNWCLSVCCRESRTHCIDIETAYMQGCDMLDQAVLVRDSCLLIYILIIWHHE